MRDFIRTGALAFVFVAGLSGANAQQLTPQAETQGQTSPQNGESPAKVDDRADEAARERLQEMPDTKGADVKDARGGEGTPTPDQIVGPPNAGPVPLRGEGLDLPGATAQTAPAKYSSENAEKLDYSIMGYPVQLNDEQKRAIWNAVGSRSTTASSMGETIFAEAGVFLPPHVQAEELPGSVNQEIPQVRGMKYVKTDDKVLLVAPSNGIVRGVIDE